MYIIYIKTDTYTNLINGQPKLLRLDNLKFIKFNLRNPFYRKVKKYPKNVV